MSTINQFNASATQGRPQRKLLKDMNCAERLMAGTLQETPDNFDIAQIVIRRVDRMAKLAGTTVNAVWGFLEKRRDAHNIPMPEDDLKVSV